MKTENRETFFARLEPMLSPSDLVKVQGAYIFAKFGHRAQKRRELDEDGEYLRYFEHCRGTALILIDELGIYDADMICAALLHDCLEDTKDVTVEVIEQFFGPQVARWVRQLSKVPKEGYFERLRYADEKALVVKFADRIHNVRSFPDRAFAIRKIKEGDTYIRPLLKESRAHALLDEATGQATTKFGIEARELV